MFRYPAAAAKSLQSCPTLCDPHRRQPTRLPCPWDSPGKNTGVGCHCLLQCRKVKSESEVTQSCLTLSDPMDCSPEAPPSMGFSRQEYWSGLLLPSPGTAEKSYPNPRSGVAARRSYTMNPCPRPGAVAGRTNPTSEERWLHGRKRA